MAILRVNSIRKQFNSQRRWHWRGGASSTRSNVIACDDIGFEARSGELIAVAGPNGSGKTTLLKIIAGAILPDSGSMTWHPNGVDGAAADKGHLLCAMSGESSSFYSRLTGRENLNVFAAFYDLSAARARAKISELLSFFDAETYADKIFQEYSAGMRQRFSLIRSLLAEAPVLLFDEPTKNLDPDMAQKFKHYVRQVLCQERAKIIIWTSHILSEIAEVADKVILLKDGKMKAIGSLEELGRQTHFAKHDLDKIYHSLISLNP